MDIGIMIEFFKRMCQTFARECEQAISPDDVEELEFKMCKIDGMRELLQAGNDDMPLDGELLICYFSTNCAFLCAHNRIMYNPITGDPITKNA